MKRFYRLVTTLGNEERGYAVQLDGKTVKMPSGGELIAPTERLAEAMMKEWAAQGEEIVPDTMPLTQILTTVLDRVRGERAVMAATAINYLDTDLLCYRAERPAELVRRQDEAWNTWLDWFRQSAGVRLETTTGLSALEQPEEAHDYAWKEIEKMDDYRFGVFQLVVSITGSLVLGLAFTKGKISAEQALETIRIEENYKAAVYNEEKHGLAPHEEKKVETLSRDLKAAEEFLSLV